MNKMWDTQRKRRNQEEIPRKTRRGRTRQQEQASWEGSLRRWGQTGVFGTDSHWKTRRIRIARNRERLSTRWKLKTTQSLHNRYGRYGYALGQPPELHGSSGAEPSTHHMYMDKPCSTRMREDPLSYDLWRYLMELLYSADHAWIFLDL